MSTTVTSTDTVWAVVDRDGAIVLLCGGHDAGDVTEEWRARGYRVLPVDNIDGPSA